MTTKYDIDGWFDKGLAQNASHLIVCYDSFDYSDYPRFPKNKEECEEMLKKNDSGDQIMEVYDLSKDKEWQLNQPRAWNI